MKPNWKITLWLSSIGVLISPLAQAQFCGLTIASLNGSYGYVASQAGTVPTPVPAGTPATTTYSSTAIGDLLSGISAGNQLALSGVWKFDGVGNVNATSAPGGAATHVGAYTVNPDCSVTVSLTDTFGTNTLVTQLAGVALGSGAEIDLTLSASLESPATSTAQSGVGLAIRLVRVLYQNGCSISNLRGLYGFVLNPTSAQAQTVATGLDPITSPTVAAFQSTPIVGYLEFDGLGHIVALSTPASPTTPIYTALQYTGAYSVNLDCSGSITMSNSSTASTATDASRAMTLNFVITPPTAIASGHAPSPGLDLCFLTADESGTGYATAQ